MADQTGLYCNSTSVKSTIHFGCSIPMQQWEATDYGTLPILCWKPRALDKRGMSLESTLASEQGTSANLIQETLGRNP